MSTTQRILTLVVLALLAVGSLFFLSTSRPGGKPPLLPRDATEGSSSTPVVQSHRGYSVEVVSDTDGIRSGRETTISYRIKNDRGGVLKDFAVAHEKIMHFIAVRKDLQHFQHLHPTFEAATGTFSIEMTFPADGPYRLFADFTLSIDNPQSLPVTVFVDVVAGDEKKYIPQPVVPDAEHEQIIGAYRVTYEFPGTLKAQTPVAYSISIAKNDEPVINLESYLGALGHSVFLKTYTLDFIHTHAEEQDGRARGPLISFSTTFPEPGLYKAFTQFQYEGRVLTTEHVVSVENGSGETKSPEHGGGHPAQ